MNQPSTTRILWLVLLVAAGLLAWQFQDGLETIFAGRGRLEVERRGGAVVLDWRGKIEAPMAARLKEAFASNAGDTRRFLLVLNSPGGTIDHGADVIRIVQAMQQTHTVDTLVLDRRVCASMCVPVYLAGGRRAAGPRARFMFHEVSYRDVLSDKKKSVPEVAVDRATDQLFERYFTPAGVDAAWLAEMRKSVRGKDVWLTAEQLVDQRAGIVQRLE